MKAFVLDLVTEILGDKLTPVTLVATYIFAFVGIFIRWYFDTKKGLKTNPLTPVKFSFIFWLQNNLWHKLVSCMAVVCVVFVLVRFPSDFGFEYAGYFGALILGLALDYFIDIIRKKVDSIKKV